MASFTCRRSVEIREIFGTMMPSGHMTQRLMSRSMRCSDRPRRCDRDRDRRAAHESHSAVMHWVSRESTSDMSILAVPAGRAASFSLACALLSGGAALEAL